MVKDLLTGETISERNSSKVIKEFSERNKFGKTIYPERFPLFVNVNGSSMPIMREIVRKEFYYDELYDVYGVVKTTPEKDIKDIPFERFPFSPLINNANSIKEKIKFGKKSPTFIISEGKKYTFGVEIETSSGYVPASLTNDLNVKCVYDGSLYSDEGRKAFGGEYVTGVLTGDAGFLQIRKILNLLIPRTKINSSCSVHVHVGNVNFNKATIVALYKLTMMLEDELYSMMPPSRMSRKHCSPMEKTSIRVSDKSYEKDIDYVYKKIVKIISMGKFPGKYINKKFNHPRGHYCGYNTSSPRYWWINFVPTLFNLKGEGNNTIEFRMHSATLNYQKIQNWILICMAIVSFAEDNKLDIFKNKSIKLEYVLEKTFPKKHQYLSKYVESRKDKFKKNHNIVEKTEYLEKNKIISTSLKGLIWD